MKKISLLLLMIMLTSSCVPSKFNRGQMRELLHLAPVSTLPQAQGPYVGLIQLHSPALLSDAKIIDGKTVISEEAKKNVLEEQETFINKLQALSPDIKIISRYKLVLNAISFVAPGELALQIAKMEDVNKLLESTNFERPKTFSIKEKISQLSKNLNIDLNQHNSVSFIGADKLHKLGISGQNMRVGIIDTGTDYTHLMLGGNGKKTTYDSIDPSKSSEYFPNLKVVGGADFVGSDYSAGDANFENNIPKRDSNPLDEARHGSHVSGTVAGIGDGIKTYSGVAPEAKLYALKVFGKKGSTSDVAVIAALEYAADPSEQLDPSDRLDVVNLSLGGGYGKPKILYSEAIHNLTRGGTVVVASAGNAGDNPYIVGAPSTADEAISVAAGIDDMPQNIGVSAAEVKLGDEDIKLIQAMEGEISPPASESHVSGKMIYIGNGTGELSPEIQAQIKGKIALIDRGVISFVDKLKLAEKLGAIGAVIANNQDGDPFKMGGDGKVQIPGVMISKVFGDSIKNALANNLVVEFNFSPGKIITRNELIDTITDFSSRGPRSSDSLIKPEITGPGANIISAEMGSGTEGIQFSGTSMSGPHIAGVMTLLKQAFPTLTVADLKAKVLNTSKILMINNVHVPVSLQGAGRVQVEQAYLSSVIATPATLSLGEVTLSSQKSVNKKITLRNISTKNITFSMKSIHSKNIQVADLKTIQVKALSTIDINIRFNLTREAADKANIEADGFIILESTDGLEKINLPFLAVLNKITNIKASDFLTMTNSTDDKVGAAVSLTLTNTGKNSGDALIFNLLGTDDRQILTPPFNLSKGASCDLESAGIRVISKEIDGSHHKVLQVGVKLYDELTLWQPCDISMQIDSNNDGIADLELAGIKSSYVSGITFDIFSSLLLNATEARAIRKTYEGSPTTEQEDYSPALIDAREMKFYDHSNIAVIETDLSNIAFGKNGNIGIKVSVSNVETDESARDYLANHGRKWQTVNLSENNFAFYEMPEVVSIAANSTEQLVLRRGNGKARLLVLYPFNAPSVNDLLKDQQSQILIEKFQK